MAFSSLIMLAAYFSDYIAPIPSPLALIATLAPDVGLWEFPKQQQENYYHRAQFKSFSFSIPRVSRLQKRSLTM